MGGASFAHRKAQIATEFSRSGSSQSGTTGASLGATPGPFLSLGGGLAHDDSLHDNATVFTGMAGMGFALVADPETEFCPFLTLRTINDVDLPSGESVSSRIYGAGLGLGARLSAGSGFEVVPFAGAAVLLQTSTITFGIEPERAVEGNYFNGLLGLGFVIRDVFAIRPSANFAVAHGQTTTSYGLGFSYSFGRVTVRPRPAPGEGSLATVWVNPRAMIYYCSSSRWYGGTADGSFMTEREALAAGYTPDLGKRC
jgi:hypothetical protein